MADEDIVESLLHGREVGRGGGTGQRILDGVGDELELVGVAFLEMALDGAAHDPTEDRENNGRGDAEK